MKNTDEKVLKHPITSLLFYLTETCNLACSYCFVKQSDQATNLTTGKRVIDFLINESGPFRDLHLRFFGGEPLLQFQLLEDIAVYAREQKRLHHKNIQLEVISNCLLLNDKMISKMKSLDIKLLFSLDGRPETLKQNRGISLSTEAYTAFILNIKKSIKEGIGKEFCMTISISNQSFIEDIQYIRTLDENIPIRITLETNPNWEKEHLSEIYQKLTMYYLENAANGQILPLALTNYLLLLKHQETNDQYNVLSEPTCMAGRRRFGVSTNGDIYFCHRLLDTSKEFESGNVFTGINEEKRSRWLSDSEKHKNNVCRNCEVLKYCQKSCAAVNLMNMNDVFVLSDITCYEFKQHMKMVITIYNTLIKNNNKKFTDYLDHSLQKQQNNKYACLMHKLQSFEEELQ
jgi:uncharacterized protein